MSATQSNLSDPSLGYDLVIAVTQASIDAMLKDMLLNLAAATQIVICCVYDADNNPVLIDYDDLKQRANGSDPFNVTAGADPATNQDLQNLAAARYAGGIQATPGIPYPLIANLPTVITLQNGTNAPVLFSLLCQDFRITALVSSAGAGASWIDQSQSSPQAVGTPWCVCTSVALDTGMLDVTNPPPQATAALQQRISDLTQSVGAGAFSVQQLLLALDSATLASTPAITGIPAAWPPWPVIAGAFLGPYMAQVAPGGNPALTYSVTVNQPNPATLQLGALSYECCALLNGSSPIQNPTQQQQAAATLSYLGTTGTTPPVAVPFPWNWIELGEVGTYSGVQAVRRADFVNFLAGMLNADVGPLSQATKVSLSHHDEDFDISYGCQAAPNPSSFQPVNVGPPASDGFTEVLSLAYACKSHDSSSLTVASVYGDFNYTVAGSVAFQGNTIRLVIHAQALMGFSHHELGVHYHDLPDANYYDKTFTFEYQLLVSAAGALVVTPTSSVQDNSARWNFHAGGIAKLTGAENQLKGGLQVMNTNLAGYFDSKFTSYADAVTGAINGQNGWVFPGAQSFLFGDIAFSSGQDLVAHLTYAATS